MVVLDGVLQMMGVKAEACSLDVVSLALSDCSHKWNFSLNYLFLQATFVMF